MQDRGVFTNEAVQESILGSEGNRSREGIINSFQTACSETNSITKIIPIGSTAYHSENQFSDADYVIISSGVEGNIQTLDSFRQKYSSFGDLVGWYSYNPSHHYVVYSGEVTPYPLDLYFVPDEIADIVTSPSVVLKDESKSDISDNGGGQFEGRINLAIAKIGIDLLAGDYEKVVADLQEARDRELIYLLSEVFSLNTRTIKGISIDQLPEDIYFNLLNLFAKPNLESCTSALSSLIHLIKTLDPKIINNLNLNKILSAFGESNIDFLSDFISSNINIPKMESDQLPVEKAEVILEGKNGDLCYVFPDDAKLNEVIEEFALSKDKYAVTRIGPNTFRIKINEDRHRIIHVLSAPIYNILLKNQIAQSDETENELLLFDNTPEYMEDEPAQDNIDLLLKGYIRTFRLLSKMQRSDYMSVAYILSDIRNRQLSGLQALAPLSKSATEQHVNDLFPKPTSEECRKAILATLSMLDLYLTEIYGDKFETIQNFKQFADQIDIVTKMICQ